MATPTAAARRTMLSGETHSSRPLRVFVFLVDPEATDPVMLQRIELIVLACVWAWCFPLQLRWQYQFILKDYTCYPSSQHVHPPELDPTSQMALIVSRLPPARNYPPNVLWVKSPLDEMQFGVDFLAVLTPLVLPLVDREVAARVKERLEQAVQRRLGPSEARKIVLCEKP